MSPTRNRGSRILYISPETALKDSSVNFGHSKQYSATRLAKVALMVCNDLQYWLRAQEAASLPLFRVPYLWDLKQVFQPTHPDSITIRTIICRHSAAASTARMMLLVIFSHASLIFLLLLGLTRAWSGLKSNAHLWIKIVRSEGRSADLLC